MVSTMALEPVVATPQLYNQITSASITVSRSTELLQWTTQRFLRLLGRPIHGKGFPYLIIRISSSSKHDTSIAHFATAIFVFFYELIPSAGFSLTKQLTLSKFFYFLSQISITTNATTLVSF